MSDRTMASVKINTQGVPVDVLKEIVKVAEVYDELYLLSEDGVNLS